MTRTTRTQPAGGDRDALRGNGSRTVARRAVTGRPTGGDLVDAGALLVLVALALWGLRTTFDSPRFLVAGLAGAALGIAVAHLATTLRQHWLVLAVLAALEQQLRKSGRQVIAAKRVIDCTGDGDIAHWVGCPTISSKPPASRSRLSSCSVCRARKKRSTWSRWIQALSRSSCRMRAPVAVTLA